MKKLSVGEKIQIFRKQRSLSQLDLEVMIGTSPGSVSRIESGKANPSKETLTKIGESLNLNCLQKASLFGIDMSDLPSLVLEKISSSENLSSTITV